MNANPPAQLGGSRISKYRILYLLFNLYHVSAPPRLLSRAHVSRVLMGGSARQRSTFCDLSYCTLGTYDGHRRPVVIVSGSQCHTHTHTAVPWLLCRARSVTHTHTPQLRGCGCRCRCGKGTVILVRQCWYGKNRGQGKMSGKMSGDSGRPGGRTGGRTGGQIVGRLAGVDVGP